MRSRGERLRIAGEWAARVCGVAALAGLLLLVTRPASPAAAELFDAGELASALERWTRVRPTGDVHLEFREAPDAAPRDWLAALRATGVSVTWRAPGVPALAVTAEQLPDPRGRSRVSVAGPAGAQLAVRDASGPIDSLSVASIGASLIAGVIAPVTVDDGGHSATSSLPDSIDLRRLLVLGRAGWEARFVVEALEEQGWGVDARLTVAPGAIVRHGPRHPIDTGRYAAVLALDTTVASEASSLRRYARSGGGVIIAGSAGRAPALAALAPARVAGRVQPQGVASGGPATLATLGYFALRPVSERVVRLDERNGDVAVAAHRVGAGRVLQVGHDETWRWRMAGGDDGPAAHRAWWGAMVSAAAFAPVVRTGRVPAAHSFGDDAPLAALAAVLGAPAATRPIAAETPADRSRLEMLLLALALVAFLSEWASRRFRGAA